MSETNQAKKNYMNGIWVSERTFQNGDTFFRVGVLPEKFITSIKTLKIDKDGFAHILIKKSKNPKPGNTHFVVEDDFVPNIKSPEGAVEATSSQANVINEPQQNESEKSFF